MKCVILCQGIFATFVLLLNLMTAATTESIPRNDQSLFKCDNTNVGSTIEIPANWTNTRQRFKFKLKAGFLGCAGGDFVKVIAPEEGGEYNRTKNEFFEASGLLRLGSEYYDTWEYCLQEVTGGVIHLKICKPLCTESMPCISKCCSIGKVFEFPNGCIPAPTVSSPWKPRMYKNSRRELSAAELEKVKLHIRQGPPICPESDNYDFEPLPSIDVLDYGLHRVPMRVRKDGTLLLLGKERSWEPRTWERYCIDDLWVNTSNATTVILSEDRPFIVNKCFDVEVLDDKGKVTPLLYVISMFLSAFFLLLTAVVYILLWDKQNVHGWTVTCHVSSMFFLYVFLGVSHLLGQLLTLEVTTTEPVEEEDQSVFEYHVKNDSEHVVEEAHVEFSEGISACTAIGGIVHLFFISTFCWLTLLNFDLWSTFKSTKPVRERSKGILRFGLYNVFAWGVAAIVVGVGFTMDSMYPDAESEVIVPQYGQVNCFIVPWAMGYYVYSVIGVLMVVNLIFISLTSCIIYRFRQTTHMIEQNRSVAAQQSFKLFSKLFVIMGVSWVFEIVSWLVAGGKSPIHWVLLDVVNISQSIAVFIIFICKHKTYDQLRHKFPALQRLVGCCARRTLGEQKLSSAQSSGTLGSCTKQSSLGRQSSNPVSKTNSMKMKTIIPTETA